jgi:uncharacterized protein
MIRRLPALTVASLALLVALATPAWAHVTVSPSTAAKGGFTTLTFKVPSESDTASTVKLQVAFPDPSTAPIASASVRPKAGWTYQVEKQHLSTPIQSDDGAVTDVVSTITWTADASSAIKPGEFDSFDISVGPLPTKVDTLEFKAVQTYSDGNVVRWIEEPTGGKAPDHPAPTITLTAAAQSTTATTVQLAAPASSASTSSSSSSDGTARALGIAGLVAGLLALLLAVLGFVRKPKTS